MKSKPSNAKSSVKAPAEQVVKNIRRQTRRHFSAEDKIRIVLDGLPKGFHRIRHYGLLAGSTRKARLERARELLGVAPPPLDEAPAELDDYRPPCPCCGGRMVIIETFERRRQPRAPPSVVATTRTTAP